MPEIGTVKRAWRRWRISRHRDLLSSNRPVSAHRAERRCARLVRTGGLLPFPRTGCVLVRNVDRNPIDAASQSKMAVRITPNCLGVSRLAQILDLFGEDSRRNVYAGELEVRPPCAPTTHQLAVRSCSPGPDDAETLRWRQG